MASLVAVECSLEWGSLCAPQVVKLCQLVIELLVMEYFGPHIPLLESLEDVDPDFLILP